MEKRQLQQSFRSNDDSRIIEGYAVVFEKESEDLGFIEIIHRGAITQELIDKSDVLCNFNHNNEKVLARSNKGFGSLQLELDDHGLKFRCEAPHTELGNTVLEHIRRNEIDSCSFCFTVDKNDKGAEKWSKREGKLYREIFRINGLYDVSVVFQPAYQDTTVSQRYKEVKANSLTIDNKINRLEKEFLDEIEK